MNTPEDPRETRPHTEAASVPNADRLPTSGSSYADNPPYSGGHFSPSDDALLADVLARGERAGSGDSSTSMLVITAVLFIALGGVSWGWRSVVFLAVAIGLHELGHVLAMRIFGYKNVRMLFLPFFGGLATGEPRELDATKNALVSLAGPAFGIATAALAGGLAWLSGGTPWLVEFAWVALVLNAFNLLPIVPLDGGQFTNDTLFSRFPVLELAFRLLAIVVLGWFAVKGEMWLLGIVAFFMLLGTPVSFRRAQLIRDARRDPSWQTRPLDRGAVADLRTIVAGTFKGVAPEKYQSKLAGHVHGVWLEIRKRFPGPGRTVALLAGYAALTFLVVPALGILFAMLLPRPVP
jgi:Zn-dependent protease